MAVYKVRYEGDDGYTHVEYYDAEDDNYDLQRAISVELESDTLENIYTDGVDYWFEDDSGEKKVVMHVLEIEED